MSESGAPIEAAPADEPSLTPSQDAGSLASLLGAVARTGHSALTEGTVVADQYAIIRPIGEGGMGVVYLARDARLGREVAVKLCIGLSASAVHRIQREAMALAKLAHPNVVVVYQAGEMGSRFFIVMEYVAGGTVTAWLADEKRSVAEIVALYAAAGDGLAAAHRAGLVHRDFKPDNVLVGGDGRPRVADFGLARTTEDIELADTASAEPFAVAKTQAGTIVGTLAYMAPEQLAGATVDARADQYAFAVSLWEALFDVRPTRADTVLVTDPQSRASAPVRASGDAAPRHIVAALQRALAEDKADRWPDMNALLTELRRDPAAKRRRTAAIVGALAIVCGGAIGAFLWAPDEPCSDAPVLIADVWGPARAGQLAAVVGEAQWPAIEERVVARVDAWIEQHRAACRATRIDGSASDEVLDTRMLCLDGRKRELAAILNALEQGSPTAIGNAVETIDTLASSEDCLRPLPFGNEPLPSDPELRARITEAQAINADLSARSLDPAAVDAMDASARAVELARSTDWRPSLAIALANRATVLHEMGRRSESLEVYAEAQHMALAGGLDELAVQVLSDQAWAYAEFDRFAEAKQALDTAQALWERTGSDPYYGQRYLMAVTEVAWQDHRPEDALAALQQQVALAEEAFGDSPTSQAANYSNLALGYQRTGRHDEAQAAIERAIELARSVYGDDHPAVAKDVAIAATLARERGDHAMARELAERALAVYERWFGPDDPRGLIALDVLSGVAQRRGEDETATRYMTRALEIRKRTDPASAAVAEGEANLAIVAVQAGDYASAAPRASAALAALERLRGPESSELVRALVLTGYIAREKPEPDLDASVRDLTRAHGLATSKLGPDNHETVNVEIELANTLLAQGRAPQAIALLEARLPTIDELDIAKHTPPELRFTLARAYTAAGDKAGGCALAERAEAEFRSIDAPPLLEATRTWRDKHCG